MGVLVTVTVTAWAAWRQHSRQRVGHADSVPVEIRDL